MNNTEHTTGLNLQAFDFEEAPVRVLCLNDLPWFVLADVCRVLGMTNPSMMVKALDEDERAKVNLGRQGEANIINESGLYTLILRCDDAIKPGSTAHRFRKWVTGEVLPTLRKEGAYSLAKAAERDERAERLEAVRVEIVSHLREIEHYSSFMSVQGAVQGRVPTARVKAFQGVTRVRLEALQMFWELESAGTRAVLSSTGRSVAVVNAELPEAA